MPRVHGCTGAAARRTRVCRGAKGVRERRPAIKLSLHHTFIKSRYPFAPHIHNDFLAISLSHYWLQYY